MLVDVAVPEIGIDTLTYESGTDLQEGLRVIVEVVRTKHTGFVLGPAQRKLPRRVAAKKVEGVIDDSPVVPPDIWDLAMWSARVSMCGAAKALNAALPVQVCTGEKLIPPPAEASTSAAFHERTFFNPFDSERVNFFADELKQGMRTLVLFPRRDMAGSFFESLPDTLKAESVLWDSDSPKFWDTWRKIHAHDFRVVVAPPGGVFAPFTPGKIIVEDESSPSYVIPYTLSLSARSLAGHRAQFLNAELITAGFIPSLKTYIRAHPRETLRPDRRNIILADIHQSRKESLPGIEGNIPLTHTLTSRTHIELGQGHNVVWILSRTGEASEVFCENCGESVRCDKCGGVMQAVNDGELLRCHRCGKLRELPPKCESCGYDFLTGKRPGIDALAKIAGRYFAPVHVYTEGSKLSDMAGLILSTRRGVELCGKISPSLVAWLDLESELWMTDHTNRYNVYRSLLASYWHGRTHDSSRRLLIQARAKGMRLAGFLSGGWTRFIPDELKARRDFLLPPYGYTVEVACSSRILREEMMTLFTEAGLFVMDPGEDDKPLYVSCETLDAIRGVIEAKSFVRNTKKQYIRITVRSE